MSVCIISIHCIHTLGWSSNFSSCAWLTKNQSSGFVGHQPDVSAESQRCCRDGHIYWPQTREKSIARFALWPFQVCIHLLSILYIICACTLYSYICMDKCMHIMCISTGFRSTPVEVLHTVLLGPYKYLTGTVMAKLSAEQKREVQARLSCADYSGIEGRMSSNITRYSQSFVGRDFKVWAQIAPFILAPYLTSEQLKLWLSLSKVHIIVCTCPV